jgi:hypothetical protein
MKSPLLLKVSILLTCFILTSCTKEIELPAYGLILHYSFDRNLKDLSGNNNDGINYTSSNYVAGIRGLALDFNGTSDYIQLSRTINSENGLSFSFWIKSRGAAATENNGVIIGKYNMTANYRCFMIYSFGAYETRNDNRLSAAFYKYGYSSSFHDNVKSYLEPGELSVFPSDPSLWTIINPERIRLGTWTHCVINVTATTVEAWINGTLCTKKQREYLTYFDSPDEPVYIGNILAGGAGSNNHFNGVIDELRIYNRELTKKEIQILFYGR